MANRERDEGGLGPFGKTGVADVNRSRRTLRENWGWVDEVVQALAAMLELRDSEVGGHTHRVVQLALAIGAQMGLGGSELCELRRAAYLHDLGKIAVPDHILHKPQPLTADEWQTMRRHPISSYLMASRIPGLSVGVLDAILQHHERWQGQGYPSGLHDEEIHWAARVLAVADSADAIIAGRIYQPARSVERARQEIGKLRGILYDPAVIDAFLRLPQHVFRRPHPILRQNQPEAGLRSTAPRLPPIGNRPPPVH